jgi:hypothetical protein
MATRRKPSSDSKPRRPPATTPEGRENQLIVLATDLAEKQLSEGTASAQVVTHYLKLGSTRERLEQDRIEQENELLRAKVEAMASVKRLEDLYETALNAMRSYSGATLDPELDD